MPQRDPRSSHDLQLQQAVFTFDDSRRKLGCHGSSTQKEPCVFNACSICLQPVIAPMSCNKGHLFCKECIFECLLAQKKNIKRKLASLTNREKSPDKDEELKQQQRDLDLPDSVERHIFDTSSSSSSNAIQRVSSYEEEALRTMKAFWLPYPEAAGTPVVDLQLEQQQQQRAPSFDTFCPEGHEKLKLKDLFQVAFTMDDQDREVVCPSCSVTLTGAPVALAAISTCGHMFCKRCADQVAKECMVCHKPCKAKNVVVLERSTSGFSPPREETTSSFKCVGSANEGVVA